MSIIVGKQSTWLYYINGDNPPYKIQCAPQHTASQRATL